MNLNENQSYDADYLGDTFGVGTSGNKLKIPDGLSQADLDTIESHINEMTRAERVADNDLKAARQTKLAELDAEYLKRIQVVDEDLTLEGLSVLEILWLSVKPTARQANADMASLVALHQARKAIRVEARALTKAEDVLNYDVVNNELWP